MTADLLPLARPALIHASSSMTDAEFFDAIDATGGWPVGYRYVQFYHAMDNAGRTCRFTNDSTNTGWWTTICTRDQYLWSRISDSYKLHVAATVRVQIADTLHWWQIADKVPDVR